MKHKLLAFIVFVSALLSASAATRSFTISFSEKDFNFSYNEKGELVISPINKTASYPDADQPCLPILPSEIVVEAGLTYESATPSFTPRLILSNVTMAHSPEIVPTDGSRNPVNNRHDAFTNASYPLSNCSFATSSNWDKVSILHFLACPFVYNAEKKELYFIDSISLKVNLKSLPSMVMAQSSGNTRTPEVLRSGYEVNPEVIDTLVFTIGDDVVPYSYTEYLIITSETLKNAFEPLREWKQTKGLQTEIATIEQIESLYSGTDTTLKIKKYLYNKYNSGNLKFVMLGGDDSVVPTKGCYVSANGEHYDNMPTDLYYSCFGGNWDWDANGNGLAGEIDDNVNMAPSIYVSRVPVRTEADVAAYLGKLIAYEKNPAWTDKILMSGVHLFSNNPIDDAEKKADTFYSQYFAPYWQGEKYKFFDTYTDFPGGASYDVSSDNLNQVMSKGYNFIDMTTHGGQTVWVMENGPYYDETHGGNLVSPAHSIISTIACVTNAFDSWYDNGVKKESYDPCLSESFIRNPNSGVIGYLGCSREGWDTWGYDLGPSFQYNAKFYTNLFTSAPKDRLFGKLVAAAKYSMVGLSSANNSYRWIQFGLNPIGDPEMQVYCEQPKTFDNASVKFSNDKYVINAGVDSCRICIKSDPADKSLYYRVAKDKRTLSVGSLPSIGTICITKPGYAPKIFNLPMKSLGIGTILSHTPNPANGYVKVTTEIPETASSASLVISNMFGNREKVIPLSPTEKETSIDVSSISAGMHILSLYVDGQLADSSTLTKH